MTRRPFDLDPADPRVEVLAGLYRERYGARPSRARAGGAPTTQARYDQDREAAEGSERQALLLRELDEYERTCEIPRRGRHTTRHLRVAS